MAPQPYLLTMLTDPGFLATEGSTDMELSKSAVRMERKPAAARKIR
jgi:hypothetical protein